MAAREVVIAGHVQDTVPRSVKYVHIRKPGSRYVGVIKRVYVPSVKLPGQQEIPASEAATAADSSNLAEQITQLLNIIRNNYTPDIDNYVDTINELSKIKNLGWTNKKVYRRDVNGIAFNLSLLQNIFQKSSFDQEDVEMLSLIFNTNDSLIRNTKIHNYVFLMLSGISYQFTILDNLDQPVPQAICYFINKPDWRTIENSKSCAANPFVVDCNMQIIPDLEEKCKTGKLNYLSDQEAMQKLKLSFGPYHVLVLTDGKLRYHQILPFDESTPVPYTIKLMHGQ